MDDRLYRSVDDRMLAGVAGGLAERLDADPSIIRVVWALLTVLTGGIALVAYIVMAIVVPDAPDGGPMPPTRTAPDPTGPPPDPDSLTSAIPVAAPLAAPGAEPAPASAGGWIAPNGQEVARADAPSASRRRRPGAGDDGGGVALIGGLVLILIGVFFLVRQFIPAIDLGSWWPLILVGIGVILVVMSVAPGRKSG